MASLPASPYYHLQTDSPSEFGEAENSGLRTFGLRHVVVAARVADLQPPSMKSHDEHHFMLTLDREAVDNL